jgi:putative ABC transport system permease protein
MMIAYHLKLAAASVRRHPVLTLLIVVGIALGVGLSTWALTIRHVLSRNPVPGKSDVLHYVRMDSWDPDKQAPHPGGVPTQITYRDMRAIMESPIPARKTGTYKTKLFVHPSDPALRPSRETIRLVFADFFEMFEVPFREGGAWGRLEDERPAAVAVIGADFAEKLFGAESAIGQPIRLHDRDFTIVGVLEDWRPGVKVYDMTQNPTQPIEPIFIPFNWILPMELDSAGNTDGWAPTTGETFAEVLASSESVFIQMWVELASDQSRQAFQGFLDAYALEQRELGRFLRPLDNRLTKVPDLMEEWSVVPEQAHAMAYASVMFLVVCALNLIGLFMVKFLARTPLVGIRRALGASRTDVFVQHVVEALLVGLAGGVIGLALAAAGLWLLNRWFAALGGAAGFFRLDATMFVVALALALGAGLVAGLYPAWRICRLAPARCLDP